MGQRPLTAGLWQHFPSRLLLACDSICGRVLAQPCGNLGASAPVEISCQLLTLKAKANRQRKEQALVRTN